MANELKHKSVGTGIASDSAYQSVDMHIADGQTLGDVLYFDGTSWIRKAKGFLSKEATKIVAANNSDAIIKLTADYTCDGSADQVEIQAAIDAAGSGIVYLAKGQYNLTAAISIAPTGGGQGIPVQIEGDGFGTKIFQTTTNLNAIEIGASGTTTTGFSLKNLRIGTVAGTGHAIQCKSVDRSTFENILIRGAGSCGFYAEGLLCSKLTNIQVTVNTVAFMESGEFIEVDPTYGIYLAAGGLYYCNDNLILHPIIEGISKGIYIGDQTDQGNNFIQGGTVEGGALAIYARDCIGLVIRDVHCEANWAEDVKLEGCRWCNVNLSWSSSRANYTNDVAILSSAHSSSVGNVLSGFIESAIIEGIRNRVTDGTHSDYIVSKSATNYIGECHGSSNSSIGPGNFVGVSLLNTNNDMETWSIPTIPDGYSVWDDAVISEENTIKFKNTSSCKIVSTAGGAVRYQALSLTLDGTTYINQHISVDILVYAENGGILSFRPEAALGGSGNINYSIASYTGWQRVQCWYLVPSTIGGNPVTTLRVLIGQYVNTEKTMYIDRYNVWSW